MTIEKKQEFTLKISQANKTGLITILYEMVIEYLNDSMDEFSLGKKGAAELSIGHAQDCIDELIRSLNLQYDLAKDLHRIYIFSKTELTAAGASGNMHRIWRVKKNFEMLRDAYLELEKIDNSEAVMGNTQKVYAGLTYGKHSLNEQTPLASWNRGLMA